MHIPYRDRMCAAYHVKRGGEVSQKCFLFCFLGTPIAAGWVYLKDLSGGICILKSNYLDGKLWPLEHGTLFLYFRSQKH